MPRKLEQRVGEWIIDSVLGFVDRVSKWLAPSRRRKRLAVWSGSILVALIGLGVWSSLAAEKEFGGLAAACNGEPVASAYAAIRQGRGVAFVRDQGSKWLLSQFGLPISLTSRRADEVGYVVCLESEQETVVELCRFEKGVGVRVLGLKVGGVKTGDIVEYKRVQHEMLARVVEPRSAKVLAEGIVRGTPPAACDKFIGQPSAGSFDGGPANDVAVADWLTQNLRQQ